MSNAASKIIETTTSTLISLSRAMRTRGDELSSASPASLISPASPALLTLLESRNSERRRASDPDVEKKPRSPVVQATESATLR